MEATIIKPKIAHRDAGSEMQRWAAERGFGPGNFFLVRATKEYRLIMFTLDPKRLNFSCRVNWLICKSTNYDTNEKDNNLCNRQAKQVPFRTSGPPSFVPAFPPSHGHWRKVMHLHQLQILTCTGIKSNNKNSTKTEQNEIQLHIVSTVLA
jgi:hypothetical protein